MHIGTTREQRKVNRCNPLITRGKWTNEALEEAMDVIENGKISLKKASRHWNILITSLSNHLYGKTRYNKPRPLAILTIEEVQVVVT